MEEVPSCHIFSALQSGDIRQLWGTPPAKLRPFLPCLVHMVLGPAFHTDPFTPHSSLGLSAQERERVVTVLISDIPEVNAIGSYLSMNFQELRADALKEKQLLKKLGPGEERGAGQSVLATSMQFGLAIEFERSDPVRRFRLFLSEILRVMSKVDNQFALEQSDLFESDVHLEEISDIMAIAVTELPTLLPVVQVTEALLRLHNGPHLLTCLMANLPDQFDRVITSLLVNGEVQDEVTLAGRCRTAAISSLCLLHPPSASLVQTLSLLHHKHPTLALSIALSAEEQSNSGSSMRPVSQVGVAGLELGPDVAPPPTGVVTLLHNIIIAGDEQTRAWFSQYMKLMQQKYRRQRTSAVTKLRKFIMKTLLSYTKPHTRSHSETKSLERGNQNETIDTMETEDTQSKPQEVKGHLLGTEVKMDGEGEGEGERGEGEEGGGGEEEKEGEGEEDSEIEVDAALELVDQMEIEISDGEGEESPKSKGGDQEKEVDKEREKEKEAERKPSTVLPGRGPGREGAARLPLKRKRHSSVLENVEFPAISVEKQLTDDQIVELMNLLHICCGLKLQSQMYLTNEETAVILSLITCTCPPFSPAGVRFIQITLSMLLACPFLISGAQECEDATERWLQWLLDHLPEFDRACGDGSSYGEMLLLIAIHLREKQLPQLEELISSTLDMKITGSRSGHFSHLRQLFLKVFTEEVVCIHAVSVPPTPDLNGSLTGYLPVHCIHQLIKTRTFRKHGISIRDWMYQQLLNVSEPLHPTLPPLTQEYVNAILLSNIHGRGYTPGSGQGHHSSSPSHTPFSAEDVLKVFCYDKPSSHSHSTPSPPHSTPSPPHSTPSQLLMLFYVLLYQDCYHSNLKNLLLQSDKTHSTSSPAPYGPHVLAQIPVKQLLLHAKQNHAHYSTLFPSLLRLTATHLPQLCLVEDWLKGEEERGIAQQFSPLLRFCSTKITPPSAEQILKQLQSSPSKALILLSHLSTLPPTSLVPYCHSITSSLPLLLSPSVARRIQELYLSLWTQLNLVIPRRLWLETVSALRPPSMHQLPLPTHPQLTEDPLTVLRCDRRVFRCPPVFEILLRVLAAYTSASRAWLQEQCHTQKCIAMATGDSGTSLSGHMSKQEREELCVALIAAQESAIVQLLLEICLPTSEDEKTQASLGPHLSVLREVQCLVCSYLHQTFIAESRLVKLVHFQGYPEQLLPVVVSGIPSIHICLEFIPELVKQPQTEKQQFGVLLASYVAQQYPLPESLKIVEDIFKRLLILTNEIPTNMREEYFTPLLPALVRFCHTFPPLCSNATHILATLSRMCTSGEGVVVGRRAGGSGGGGGGGGGEEEEGEEEDEFADQMREKCSTGFLGAIQRTFQELVETAVVKF